MGLARITVSFRVLGLGVGFRLLGLAYITLGFWVLGLGFGFRILGFWAFGLLGLARITVGFRVLGLGVGFRLLGLAGLGFRVVPCLCSEPGQNFEQIRTSCEHRAKTTCEHRTIIVFPPHKKWHSLATKLTTDAFAPKPHLGSPCPSPPTTKRCNCVVLRDQLCAVTSEIVQSRARKN